MNLSGKVTGVGLSLLLFQGCAYKGNKENVIGDTVSYSVNKIASITEKEIDIPLKQQKRDYYNEILNYINQASTNNQKDRILVSQIENFSYELLYSKRYQLLSEYLFDKYGDNFDYTIFFKDEFLILLNKHFLGKIKESIDIDIKEFEKKLLFPFDISNINVSIFEIDQRFTNRPIGAILLGNTIYIAKDLYNKIGLDLTIHHELGHYFLEKELGFYVGGGLFLSEGYILNGYIHEFIADAFGLVYGMDYFKYLLSRLFNREELYIYSQNFFNSRLIEIFSKKGIDLELKIRDFKTKGEIYKYILSLINQNDIISIQKSYKEKSQELIECIKEDKK